jgi:uncharacterized protein (DUF58 family)
MTPKELAKKVRFIEIHTRKTVNDVLAGEYHSVFKGQGMEFEEVREYLPGDEVRAIDWNVTARTGHPHIKRYREERERTLIFLADLSASGNFGTRERLKREVATELCALVAFSAVRNNDKVGLILFTDQVELFIPPDKGTGHVLRLIRELLAFEPRGTGTIIGEALAYLGRVTTRRAIVFVVSDFLDAGYEKPLRLVARRHDCIAVTVTDPAEETLPKAGLTALRDAESGAVQLVDTSSRAVRVRFEARMRERREHLHQQFASMDLDHIAVRTDRDYVRDLVGFFRMREQRR